METIQGFSKYSVTEDGRIFSKFSNKYLKTRVRTAGHGHKEVVINLIDDSGESKRRFVHRLVADAFLLNSENKPTVDHIDRDPTNNHVSNLRWATYKEQAQNRDETNMIYKTPLRLGSISVTCRKKRINPNWDAIERDHRIGMSTKDICDKYKITRQSLWYRLNKSLKVDHYL